MTTQRPILALVLFSAACHKTTARPPPPPAVQVADVVQRDLPVDYHTWVGSLHGFVNTEIKPQVEGYVRHQMYREGRYVGQGELLFLIDPRNSKALADRAKSTLERDVAALAKARLEVEGDRQLIANAVISREEFDNDLAAETQAAAAVESDRATLAQARFNRGWTQVTSPIAGIAGTSRAQVGTLVSPPTAMMTVSQVDPIKVQFNISESEYLRSAAGSHWMEPGRGAEPALELILDDGSVYPHRGTVISPNRQVDQQTGLIAIQGVFPNPGNILRPGQHPKVRAPVETRKGALLVPQRAVNELQGAYRIGVVASDGKVDVRTVRAGEQVGSMRVIDEGLRPGEKIIVDGFARVKAGMLVRAAPASGGPIASATAPPSAAPSPGR
jgi:membrane fusion protein (multidrug efflux system)